MMLLMVETSGIHLLLVVYPIVYPVMYSVLDFPGGCLGLVPNSTDEKPYATLTPLDCGKRTPIDDHQVIEVEPTILLVWLVLGI